MSFPDRKILADCIQHVRRQLADSSPVDSDMEEFRDRIRDFGSNPPESLKQELVSTLDQYETSGNRDELWNVAGILFDLSQWYLERNVDCLKGIGDKRASQLSRLEIESVGDLLHHYPRSYTDREFVDSIRDLEPDQPASIIGDVAAKGVVRGRNPRFQVRLTDDTGVIQVNFWNQEYLDQQIHQGDTLFCSGNVEEYRQNIQFNNPEFEIIENEDDVDDTRTIKPIYPLTEGISQSRMRDFTRRAVEWSKDILMDPLPASFRTDRDLPVYQKALLELHDPSEREYLSEARERLIFEEFFFYQLLFVVEQWNINHTPKPRDYPHREWLETYLDQLPFEFTSDQSDALERIESDLTSDQPMHRLLQGDVGTGKTVVAAGSMLRVAENGYQAAMMAPTEVLAEQHYETLREQFDSLDVTPELLVSNMPTEERRAVTEQIRKGEATLVVGTHALFQEELEFGNLGYVVVDEQHRFGVRQRRDFRKKGPDVDMLVMSATPIPRSLALTVHGDLSITSLESFPTGPKQIETTKLKQTEHNQNQLYKRVCEQLESGERAFFVFPAIEENEETELTSAEETFDRVQREGVFGDLTIELLHGRMDRDQKRDIMERFRSGDVQCLFATTVVEVGIDVPEASFLIVHDSEQFGLAQLHQLRGRIGRGGQQAHCVLLVSPDATEEAHDRLDVLVRTQDGFEVARADLRQRGIGDLAGTRQAGRSLFELGDIWEHRDIMEDAREAAENYVRETEGLREVDSILVNRTVSYRYPEEREYIRTG
ncbi:MAG: ATP-dependent DNA helicase RecG [bacterium]